jgi:hypothetical protein
MAKYMFVLRPTEKKFTTVCPACAKRGEVLSSCRTCYGAGIKKKSIPQYYIQNKPIEIDCIDRDPENGVLRYWESSCEFFYETLVPALNKYVPEVPYGVHLCHDTMKSAQAECDRINSYLTAEAKKTNLTNITEN